MKWLTFKIQREPGFRFNITDLIFIIAACILSFTIYNKTPETSLYLMPLYLIFSFFLFCNVFRIDNKYEMCWYIPFISISIISIYQFNFELFWYAVIFILEPIKWTLIIFKFKSDSYKGVFYYIKTDK